MLFGGEQAFLGLCVATTRQTVYHHDQLESSPESSHPNVFPPRWPAEMGGPHCGAAGCLILQQGKGPNPVCGCCLSAEVLGPCEQEGKDRVEEGQHPLCGAAGVSGHGPVDIGETHHQGPGLPSMPLLSDGRLDHLCRSSITRDSLVLGFMCIAQEQGQRVKGAAPQKLHPVCSRRPSVMQADLFTVYLLHVAVVGAH